MYELKNETPGTLVTIWLGRKKALELESFINLILKVTNALFPSISIVGEEVLIRYFTDKYDAEVLELITDTLPEGTSYSYNAYKLKYEPYPDNTGFSYIGEVDMYGTFHDWVEVYKHINRG